MLVYLLDHLRSIPGVEDDFKTIGYYTSRAMAREAQSATAELSGFIEHPHGFVVHAITVDAWRGELVDEIASAADESLDDDFPDEDDPPGCLYSLFERVLAPAPRIVLRGVFSSRTLAEDAASARVGPRHDWGIFTVEIDASGWQDGFFTVVHST